MSFIRPDLRARAWRYREIIAGSLAVVLGTSLAVTGSGVPSVLGGLAALAPGVVEVDEAQIAYFGPRSGGLVARDLLAAVALQTGGPGPVWHLTRADGTSLPIPAGAAGADALFDVFTQLPGFPAERALMALGADQCARHELWRAPAGRLG